MPTANNQPAPIALISFNRPKQTSIAFQFVRQARPAKLYLISDGPRQGVPGEDRLVAQCRRIIEAVDWPCEVRKIYSEANLGCASRVSTGITAALAEDDRLIVLEDDCVPSPSFFAFCGELLDRYADDERVMAISGNNFQQGFSRTKASYYFSKYPHCWGWATWARAWKHFDLEIRGWPDFRDTGQLATVCTNQRELNYWTRIFNQVHAKKSSSWAFPWTLCCWMHSGLTALPDVNLVANAGFGEDATHTKRVSSLTNLPVGTIERLVHPEAVVRNVIADGFTDRWVFSGSGRRGPIQRLRHALRSQLAAA